MKPLLLALTAAALIALAVMPVRADDTASSAKEEAKPAETPAAPKLDSGDTAWMLTSTGLVLLMVPGLALFYGGMVRRKNVLGTMMHSMVALGIIGLEWVLFGYALAFGKSQGGFIGWDTDLLGLWRVGPERLIGGGSIPVYVHCMYQGMFAIITPALISGAVAERVKFSSYCLFIFLWGLIVYVPLAHWVWAFDGDGNPAGWLGNLGAVFPALKGRGALDFAGGTVVHIAAGVSGLAAILLLRKRLGYPEHAMHPNSMVLTLTGAGLLWFGWFGFNGGSALHANGQAGSALAASQIAAAAAALSWMFAEWLHKGKPTALGLASGLVAGLVAITPASGFVYPLPAMIIGLIAGVVCYAAVCLKPFLKYDDSLDAFGVHGVGGFLGAVLTGVFASSLLVSTATGAPPAIESGGALYDGGLLQVGIQLLAAGVAAAYAFVLTLGLVKGIDVLCGFTLEAKAENEGVDRSEHGEVGFDLGLAMDTVPETPPHEPRPASVPPNGKTHFTVVVDGPAPRELMRVWSSLCQAGAKPPTPEFKSVYRNLTTVKGNRFNFRGGDPAATRESLRRLFQESLDGAGVHTHVED